MESALPRVVAFWDEHVADWLAGGDPMPTPLAEWFASYDGKGVGVVTRDGFPEPYAGAILASPRLVVLGLNPGQYQPSFQARDGIFAREIRELGSYSAWMATAPDAEHHRTRRPIHPRVESVAPVLGRSSQPRLARQRSRRLKN